MGHAVMENRNGLIVNGMTTHASGTGDLKPQSKWWQSWPMAGARSDKNFDTKDFVEDPRAFKVTPHAVWNMTNRSSAIDGRTTRHEGYTISLKVCERIEEAFG